jgi:hypothetical protein
MRLVAVVLAAGLLAAGSSAAGPRALGWDYGQKRLAWFDPSTLRALSKGTAAPNPCSWSFAPGGVRLAMSDCSSRITIVDTKAMRVERRVEAARGLGSLNSVVDPLRGRVVRRVDLPASVSSRGVFDGGAAFLLAPFGRFRAAEVAVVDADGNVRTATIHRISVGTVFEHQNADPEGETRGAGFAVDPEGRRAFVVAPNLLVAEVDLRTLAVDYHGPTRETSKLVRGPTRNATWLGGGLLAVSGSDQNIDGSTVSTTPYGLHLVDTRTWKSRVLDPEASWFWHAGDVLLVTHDGLSQPREVVAWSLDGSVRYRLPLGRWERIDVQGPATYVCNQLSLVRVVATATGKTLAQPRGRPCIELLRGTTSPY